jgi:3-phenylpropionate/trans-cinnamate dioxygenase ferredoxin subunit
MSARVVCSTSDLAPAQALRVELETADGAPIPVAVVRDSTGDWHAIGDLCSHGQVSLSDGEVEGCFIECWLHGSQFDLRTGVPAALPALRPVPVFPVIVDGDSVLVDVDTAFAS